MFIDQPRTLGGEQRRWLHYILERIIIEILYHKKRPDEWCINLKLNFFILFLSLWHA